MAQGRAGPLSPVCAYVAERTGTSLSTQQVFRINEVLRARLAGRSEEEYLLHLRSHRGAEELSELMAAISVHKTDLFRDEGQLEAFDLHVLRPLVRLAPRPLRVWSAGCATGEEVATLLILLAEAGAHPESTVLGTDISEPTLETARRLRFLPELFARVPAHVKERYFVDGGGYLALVPELARRASFLRHNLMDLPYPAPPGANGFDAIFCRNVLIYFTERAFEHVVDQLSQRLLLGGTLVLSSSEPILRAHPLLSTERQGAAFFYRRVEKALAPAASPSAPRPSSPSGLGPRPARPRPSSPSLPPRPPRSAPPPAPRVTPALATPEPARRRVTGELPLPPILAGAGEAMGAEVRPARGEPGGALPAASGPRALAHAEVAGESRSQALAELQAILEAASGGAAEAPSEKWLRQCLYLDPHLAQARYLLGVLLEQRGDKAAAAGEYRRAFSALQENRAPQAPFFLNNERLKVACARALERLGQGSDRPQ